MTFAIGGLRCVSFVLTVLSLAGCSRTRSSSSGDAQLRVAYIEFSSSLPLFVAQERGYFARQGVKVTPVLARTSNEAMDSLVAGRLDASVGNALTTVLAVMARAGTALQLFLPAYETQTHSVSRFLVRRDAGIRNFAALKGKKLGTYAGSSQLLWLRLLLDRFAISAASVQIIQVPPELQISAFRANAFDALLTVEPYATQAAREVDCIDLAPNPRVRYIMSPFPAAANVTSRSVLRTKSDAMRRFCVAMRQAVEWTRKNEGPAKLLLPKYTPVTPDDAKAGGLYWWSLNGDVPDDSLQTMADLLAREGLIGRSIEMRATVFSCAQQ